MKFAWIVLVAVVLAGCGSKATPAQDIQEATTGTIRGVVVDPAIRPIPDATVSLSETRSVVTSSDGSYTLLAVPTGSYFLSAAKEGFLAAQATVTVQAGHASTVQFRLVPEARADPYYQVNEFTGFVQASAGALTPILDQTVAAAGGASCDCSFEVFPAAGLSAIVLEAIWEDSVADPTGATEYIWQVEASDPNATTASGQGPTPIVRELGRLDFPSQDFRLSDWPSYEIRIYPDATWPSISQDYSAFVSLWYMGRPPPDWSITGD